MACKLGAPWTHLEFGPGVIKCRADRSLEAFSGLQTRRGSPTVVHLYCYSISHLTISTGAVKPQSDGSRRCKYLIVVRKK